MSRYPGFTDGDLERQAAAVRRDMRHYLAMGQNLLHDAALRELVRIEAEQRERGIK